MPRTHACTHARMYTHARTHARSSTREHADARVATARARARVHRIEARGVVAASAEAQTPGAEEDSDSVSAVASADFFVGLNLMATSGGRSSGMYRIRRQLGQKISSSRLCSLLYTS